MNKLTKTDENNNSLYSEIQNILDKARNHAYTAVNSAMVMAYWSIGKVILEYEQKGAFRGEYGKGTLKNLSVKLTADYGKGFTVRSLQQMKKFYQTFQNANALRSQLSWTHYRLLIKIENEGARKWYMEEAVRNAWSSRQLERQINTFYYERILASRNKETVIQEANKKLSAIQPEEFIKDPYVLEFLNLKDYPALHETALENALIEQLQTFLLELGRGFCFVSRQKLMRYEDEDFYVDLVFYHSILKCHILIDLKIGKLTHSDVGQMDSYIRMFDDLYKNPDDNPTIGIILCSEKNEAIAKYSVLSEGKQLFASKYQFTLPTAEELQNYIKQERRKLEEGSNTI